MLTLIFSSPSPAAPTDPVSFRRDIAPLLKQRCETCHGEKKAKGKLRLDSYTSTLKGGRGDVSTVTPKDLDHSELYIRLITTDEDDRMPADADPLPSAEIELFRHWIKQGARFDGDNPDALLSTLIPAAEHPAPPQSYPRPVPIVALAFSADGAELFTGGYHEINVWDVNTGLLRRRISNQGERTYGFALQPGGNVLATTSGAPGKLGELRLFHPQDGKLIKVLATASDVMLALAFNPSGTRLAAGAADGRVRIFDTDSWEEVRVLEQHSDWVTDIAWSADGTRLVSGGRDHAAKVFDVSDWRRLSIFAGHAEAVRGVDFHPNGKEVFSGGTKGAIYRWEIENGKKTAELAQFGTDVLSLMVAGDMVVATSANGRTIVFDAYSNKPLHGRQAYKDWVTSAAVHPGTARIATGAFNGRVIVWDQKSGKSHREFVAAPGAERVVKKRVASSRR